MLHRVHVGFACNNRCRFCAQGELRHRPLAAVVEADLAEIQPGISVAFLGGEPTVSAELPGWIHAAREKGASFVLLQTNGRRIADPSYLRTLLDAGVSALDVSLHGSTAAMHDFHTEIDGSFAQTCEGLAAAAAERLPTGVTTVVTRSNFRHLVEIVELCRELGVRAVHFTLARAVGRAENSALIPIPELVRPHLHEAVAKARSLGVECAAGRTLTTPELRRWFGGLGVTA